MQWVFWKHIKDLNEIQTHVFIVLVVLSLFAIKIGVTGQSLAINPNDA